MKTIPKPIAMPTTRCQPMVQSLLMAKRILSAVQGTDSNMGTGANNNSWIRRCVWNAALNYDKNFSEKHHVYGQLKYDYEYNDKTGTNTTVYRHNISLFGHYGYDNRLLFDVAPGRERFQPYGSLRQVGDVSKRIFRLEHLQ